MHAKLIKRITQLSKLSEDDMRISAFLTRIEQQVDTFSNIFDVRLESESDQEDEIPFPDIEEEAKEKLTKLLNTALEVLENANSQRDIQLQRKRPIVTS